MKENNNDKQEANDSLITQENKPYNLQSTSNEIQNIFKKIRKKNKETELKRSKAYDYGNIYSNDILISNENSIRSTSDNLDTKDLIVVIINFISFVLFYCSFILVKDYSSLVHYFLFPLNNWQFYCCVFSGIITSGIIVLITLKKNLLPEYQK